jgi:hypothetical protein
MGKKIDKNLEHEGQTELDDTELDEVSGGYLVVPPSPEDLAGTRLRPNTLHRG